MKLNQNKSSIQPQTFDPWNLRGRLPMTPVWKDSNKTEYRRMATDGYPLYIKPEDDPYTYLKSPNPPKPEDVEKAQFIDKTYRGWTDTRIRS
jgi:hypothetical protein